MKKRSILGKKTASVLHVLCDSPLYPEWTGKEWFFKITFYPMRYIKTRWYNRVSFLEKNTTASKGRVKYCFDNYSEKFKNPAVKNEKENPASESSTVFLSLLSCLWSAESRVRVLPLFFVPIERAYLFFNFKKKAFSGPVRLAQLLFMISFSQGISSFEFCTLGDWI